VPLVSVLVAVHDDARYIRAAVDSVLAQTLSDLELLVVDDASTDETPDVLAAVRDERLVLLRNDEQAGLAASLNRGLEHATAPYVARLDADDVACRDRLERQLARIRAGPRIEVLGAAVLDIDAAGRPGRVHRLPQGPTAVRWHALFGSPFFHPTVLVDREALDRNGLRYDLSYLESEDYDLWTRLLAFAEGDNLPEVLVLKRMHAGQASARRADLQEAFQRKIALREITRVAPSLAADDSELAWRLGSGRGVSGGSAERAGEAYLDLLAAFERLHGVDGTVREAAARALGRAQLLRRMVRLAPRLPPKLLLERVGRPVRERRARRRIVTAWAAHPSVRPVPVRVTVVSPEPTPYRAPLFDRIAARPELHLTVIYAARTVAARTWSVESRHPALFLRGVRLPGVRGVFRHDYPVTPGIYAALRDLRPAVVVVSGWSTFASQAAIGWCRAAGVPYVLFVESHDLGPTSGWRQAVKGAIVPRLLRRAAGVLVVGTLARESVVARGAPPDRLRVFANTIDVAAWEERADRLAGDREETRRALGAGEQDLVVLSVARLAAEKGLDALVRAVGSVEDGRFLLVVAGSGDDEAELTRLAREADVRLHLLGQLDAERLAEAYVAADVFGLLSLHEPWAVVVNEAAASGLPLVLSDRVGAAHDLLRDGENGILVPAGDVAAAAAALRRLAEDPDFRRAAGRRSRELVREWGYEPSVESFVAAVLEATAR
jgi:glycosyltransferase involved in cell wall biosynthesis